VTGAWRAPPARPPTLHLPREHGPDAPRPRGDLPCGRPSHRRGSILIILTRLTDSDRCSADRPASAAGAHM